MNNDDGDDGDSYAVGDVFFHRRETNESNHDSLPPEHKQWTNCDEHKQ